MNAFAQARSGDTINDATTVGSPPLNDDGVLNREYGNI